MANHVIVQLATLNSLSYVFVVILHEFFLNGIKLEKVLKYKYLGNIIEAFGKLNSSFKYFSDFTLMKTSTGYWASSALTAILNDCLLNPNTYLQNNSLFNKNIKQQLKQK
jgi:hypothetical protein